MGSAMDPMFEVEHSAGKAEWNTKASFKLLKIGFFLGAVVVQLFEETKKYTTQYKFFSLPPQIEVIIVKVTMCVCQCRHWQFSGRERQTTHYKLQ